VGINDLVTLFEVADVRDVRLEVHLHGLLY
jgi:hypothetical protein